MRIEHMRIVREVAKSLSFNQAAIELNLTTSKVSRIVIDIESEYGYPLFHRTTRSVSLTAQGHIFLRHAERIIAIAEMASAEATALSHGYNGKLLLGYSGNVFADVLPNIIKETKKSLPNIQLSTHFAWSDDNIESVLRGSLDVALLSERLPSQEDSSMLLVEKQLFLAVSKNHHLSERSSVNFQDIAQESFIVGPLAKWRYIQQILDGYFSLNHSKLQIAFETDDPMTMNALIGLGVGVGVNYVLPEVPLGYNVVRIPITDLDVRIPVFLQWSATNRNPVLKPFINLVKQCYSTM